MVLVERKSYAFHVGIVYEKIAQDFETTIKPLGTMFLIVLKSSKTISLLIFLYKKITLLITVPKK